MSTHYKGTEKEKRSLDAMIKMVRAAESLLWATKGSYSRVDLSESQFAVLEALYHLGPMSQKELGEKILKTKGNLTLVVKNLQIRGLVSIEREESDRRFYIIQLTRPGKELVSKILPSHVKRIVEIFSVLSAEEQEQLAGLCRKLGLAAKG